MNDVVIKKRGLPTTKQKLHTDTFMCTYTQEAKVVHNIWHKNIQERKKLKGR